MGKSGTFKVQDIFEKPTDAWRYSFDPLWGGYEEMNRYRDAEEKKINDQNEENKRNAEAAAAASRAATVATAQGEYDKRFKALTDARNSDLSGLQERLKQWGFDETSSAWSTGMNTIFSSYEEKLKTLGSDPYFDSVRKQAGWE